MQRPCKRVCRVNRRVSCWTVASSQYRELESIGTDPPATWESGNPSVPWTTPGAPFTNVVSNNYYWTSNAAGAYAHHVILMTAGNITSLLSMPTNSNIAYVWPVRGEQAGPLGDIDNDGILNEQDNCQYVYIPNKRM